MEEPTSGQRPRDRIACGQKDCMKDQGSSERVEYFFADCQGKCMQGPKTELYLKQLCFCTLPLWKTVALMVPLPMERSVLSTVEKPTSLLYSFWKAIKRSSVWGTMYPIWYLQTFKNYCCGGSGHTKEQNPVPGFLSVSLQVSKIRGSSRKSRKQRSLSNTIEWSGTQKKEFTLTDGFLLIFSIFETL